MNTNVNAQSQRLDKQSHLLTGESGFNDTQYDYEYNDTGNEKCPSQIEFEGDSVQESQHSTSTSICKKLSNKFHQSEQVDVDVHPYLANLVYNSFRNGLSDDSLDEIIKQIHWPENSDSLVSTCVNQGTWRLLKSFTQSEDTKLTAIQGVLLNASMNLVKLVEKFGLVNSEHVELGTIAIALLGHANKMINTKSKDLHKSGLDYKYHYLASASLPYTDLLYGNDKDSTVRDINNTNRIRKANGRDGGPVRNILGRRCAGPYPAKGCGFHGRDRGDTVYRDDSN